MKWGMKNIKILIQTIRLDKTTVWVQVVQGSMIQLPKVRNLEVGQAVVYDQEPLAGPAPPSHSLTRSGTTDETRPIVFSFFFFSW